MLQLSQTALSDQLQIGHASHPGRSGKNNEDYYGVFSVATSGGECVVAAVADGIGGSVGGEQASKLTIRTIADFLEDNRYLATSPGQRLDQAIRLANRAVYDKAQSEPALLGMGTTIVAVALDGDRLYVVHAGDSRAYLIRGGRAHQLTLDHSWAQEAIEAGRITPEAAKTHPNRHVIRRYLGINDEVETDPRVVDPGQGAVAGERAATVISPILTQMGDAIVLCTDGLTDEVGDEEIAKLVSRHSPEEAARRLVDAANAAGGADNITVVVLQRGKGGGVAGAGGRSRLAALGLAAMAVLLVGALGWLLASGTLFGGQAKGAVNGEVAARVSVTAVEASTATAQPDTPAPADVPTDAPTDTPTDTPKEVATDPVTDTPTAAATATLQPFDTVEPTQQAAAGVTAAPAVASELVTGTVVATEAALATPTGASTDGVGVAELAGVTKASPAEKTVAPSTSTPVPASTKEPTGTPSAAPTSTPVQRGTATATATPTKSRPIVPTPAGSNAPDVTEMPVQITPVEIAPATPTPASGVSNMAGPRKITVVSPGPLVNINENDKVIFSWEPDVPLAPNQVYELVFWSLNNGSPQTGRAVNEASISTSVAVVPGDTQILPPGDYRWGVWLGRQNPTYERSNYFLGVGGDLHVSGSGSRHNSSGDDKTPAPPPPEK